MKMSSFLANHQLHWLLES